MWVPVTVTAALAGGVFVGAQLPSGSSSTTASPGSGGTSAPGNGSTTPMQAASAPGTPESIGTLSLTVTAGWQFTSTSKTSGCVTLSGHPAPAGAAATTAAALPCGVDALYLKTDATAATWPLSTAGKDTGWWPATVSSASDIVCPAAPSGSSTDMVKASMLLRSSDAYELAAQPGQAAAAQPTAEYHEWAVTCDTGPGVQPMLWKLNAAPGAAATTTFAVATVVSANPQYDSALLGMVGSLHQTS